MAAGGAGYVGKSAGPRELLRAIEDAARGQTPIVATFESPQPGAEARAPSGPEAPRPDDRLSERELAVLTLIAGGLSSKEVGAELGISATTVDTYRRRISAKLGTRGWSELVRYALERGLLA